MDVLGHHVPITTKDPLGRAQLIDHSKHMLVLLGIKHVRIRLTAIEAIDNSHVHDVAGPHVQGHSAETPLEVGWELALNWHNFARLLDQDGHSSTNVPFVGHVAWDKMAVPAGVLGLSASVIGRPSA